VAVGWVYGADRFAADTLEMTGVRLPKPLLWNYKLLIPALLTALSVQALVSTALGEYLYDNCFPQKLYCGSSSSFYKQA